MCSTVHVGLFIRVLPVLFIYTTTNTGTHTEAGIDTGFNTETDVETNTDIR